MNSDNTQQMGEMELGQLCEKLHAALHYQRIEEAEKTAIKLLEIAPRSTTSWELWGDVLLAQGKIEEASDALKKAVELEPKDGAAMAALVHDVRRHARDIIEGRTPRMGNIQIR